MTSITKYCIDDEQCINGRISNLIRLLKTNTHCKRISYKSQCRPKTSEFIERLKDIQGQSDISKKQTDFYAVLNKMSKRSEFERHIKSIRNAIQKGETMFTVLQYMKASDVDSTNAKLKQMIDLNAIANTSNLNNEVIREFNPFRTTIRTTRKKRAEPNIPSSSINGQSLDPWSKAEAVGEGNTNMGAGSTPSNSPRSPEFKRTN